MKDIEKLMKQAMLYHKKYRQTLKKIYLIDEEKATELEYYIAESV